MPWDRHHPVPPPTMGLKWHPQGQGKGFKFQLHVPNLGPCLVAASPGKTWVHSHLHRCL